MLLKDLEKNIQKPHKVLKKNVLFDYC